MSYMIRSVTPKDVAALMNVIEATGLFPSSMLEEMLTKHCANEF